MEALLRDGELIESVELESDARKAVKARAPLHPEGVVYQTVCSHAEVTG